MTSVYLDYQSSKPVDPQVVQAMEPYFQKIYGNPSSLHSIGDKATDALEQSRSSIADFIQAEPDEIIFASGATEANNLALIGYAERNKSKGKHIIISEIEHISIHNTAKFLMKSGFSVSKVPVNHYGQVSVHKVNERITDDTILISIGYANNEVGTIQPIEEIGRLCRDKEIAFHTDAVAAEGLLPLNVQNDSIDLMSVSSNDIYGPKGLGILYKRKGIKISPQIIGGGQENGLRSGTEDLASIAGMARAAKIVMEERENEVKRLQSYRDQLIKEVLEKIPRSYLNGHPEKRLPNNAHFRFDGIEGESLLLSLNDKGIAVSTGSACSSKTLEPSHTLISMGLLHEEAHGSLELTVGRFTKQSDIDALIKALPEVVERLRKLSPLY
ncbi:MAG: aminotransferase class V-fold PLP-dependent enzyme [Candidatus Aminicenantes bacterium]|nr:aminotransferase class V-fold PLP-dependent enzyme [Candidatus Aminicenantes bacterium]